MSLPLPLTRRFYSEACTRTTAQDLGTMDDIRVLAVLGTTSHSPHADLLLHAPTQEVPNLLSRPKTTYEDIIHILNHQHELQQAATIMQSRHDAGRLLATCAQNHDCILLHEPHDQAGCQSSLPEAATNGSACHDIPLHVPSDYQQYRYLLFARRARPMQRRSTQSNTPRLVRHRRSASTRPQTTDCWTMRTRLSEADKFVNTTSLSDSIRQAIVVYCEQVSLAKRLGPQENFI